MWMVLHRHYVRCSLDTYARDRLPLCWPATMFGGVILCRTGSVYAVVPPTVAALLHPTVAPTIDMLLLLLISKGCIGTAQASGTILPTRNCSTDSANPPTPVWYNIDYYYGASLQ